MPVETRCCPYCNSQLLLADDTVCPRCGETLPNRAGPADHEPLTHGKSERPAGADSVLAPDGDPRRSNRQTGLVLLAGMFILAAVAFVFIMLTHDFRRSHDPIPGPGTALSYVPADANIACTIQIAQVCQQPAGKQLLVMAGLSRTQEGEDTAERFLGVPLANLDRLVLTFKSNDDRFRPIILVQTRQPYDPESVRAVLDAGPPIHDGYRTVYQVRSAKLGLQAVWLAAANVFALAPDVPSLEAIPVEPRTEALPASLGDLIKNPEAHAVWITGHGENWQSDLAAWLQAIPPADRSTLNSVRSFAAWLTLDKAVKMHAKIDCANAKDATRLAASLSSIRISDVPLQLSHTDIQVTLDAKAEPPALQRALVDSMLRPAHK